MEPGTPGPSPERPAPRRPSARLAGQWFIACRSGSLGRRPLGVTVQGVPLVVFRGAHGRAGVLEDRCPHRNAPLRAGRVLGGDLECAYHGWRFDVGGACVAVPGLAAPREAGAARATAHPCVEQDGYVWTCATGTEPSRAPPRFPHLGEAGWSSVRRDYEVRSTLRRALENVLDVPHTAFLHRGLFRTGTRTDIEVRIRRFGDRCEAEFVGEPRPEGLAARLLAPGGGVVSHVDRFLLPSVAQVEYGVGESHLVVTTAMTPVDEERTLLFSVVTYRLPRGRWLVRPLVTPLAAIIFRQDARMLRLQTENVARFGGERFASTEIDVLGPQIERLLGRAERGEAPAGGDAPEHEHQVRLRL